MPEAPTDVVVEPTYNDNNLFLSRLEVQWRVQASDLVFNVSVLLSYSIACMLWTYRNRGGGLR